MNLIRALFRRELQSYFATPVAYVFIVIYLVLMGTFTFYLGQFYEGDRRTCHRFSISIRGCICFWYPPFRCDFGRRKERPAASNY